MFHNAGAVFTLLPLAKNLHECVDVEKVETMIATKYKLAFVNSKKMEDAIDYGRSAHEIVKHLQTLSKKKWLTKIFWYITNSKEYFLIEVLYLRITKKILFKIYEISCAEVSKSTHD